MTTKSVTGEPETLHSKIPGIIAVAAMAFMKCGSVRSCGEPQISKVAIRGFDSLSYTRKAGVGELAADIYLSAHGASL